MTAQDIQCILRGKRFVYSDEKDLQGQLEGLFAGLHFTREHRLSFGDIPDFFFPDTGLAIEVKIKHPKRQIYNQCLRYAAFDSVTELVLITAKNMGNPGDLHGKPFTIINLSQAWL